MHGLFYPTAEMKYMLFDIPSDKEIKSARETVKSYNLTVAE